MLLQQEAERDVKDSENEFKNESKGNINKTSGGSKWGEKERRWREEDNEKS